MSTNSAGAPPCWLGTDSSLTFVAGSMVTAMAGLFYCTVAVGLGQVVGVGVWDL